MEDLVIADGLDSSVDLTVLEYKGKVYLEIDSIFLSSISIDSQSDIDKLIAWLQEFRRESCQ